MEGRVSSEACGIDGGAQVGFGVGGPFGAVTVGDFALDDHLGFILPMSGKS